MRKKIAHDNKRVLLGARRSRSLSPEDPGHAWFVLCDNFNWEISPVWTGGKSAKNAPQRSYIGYYPMANHMPEEIKNSYNNILEAFYHYFMNNSVPGMKVIDGLARNAIIKSKIECSWLGCESTNGKLDLVWKRTHIPEGRDSVKEGKYGLNTKLPGVNNCVSWAVGILNKTLDRTQQIPLNCPPKVKDLVCKMDVATDWIKVK